MRWFYKSKHITWSLLFQNMMHLPNCPETSHSKFQTDALTSPADKPVSVSSCGGGLGQGEEKASLSFLHIQDTCHSACNHLALWGKYIYLKDSSERSYLLDVFGQKSYFYILMERCSLKWGCDRVVWCGISENKSAIAKVQVQVIIQIVVHQRHLHQLWGSSRN